MEKRKRIKISETSSFVEEGVSINEENGNTTIQDHIIGHIDNGVGFYYPDLAFETSSFPIFQSRSLFLINGCPAQTLERLWDPDNKWTIVDNLSNECIVIQRNNARTLFIAPGNKPCIMSNTENKTAQVGIWMHGYAPLDQELTRAYYNEIIEILPTDHYKKNSTIYLVLCIFPLQLLRLSWS